MAKDDKWIQKAFSTIKKKVTNIAGGVDVVIKKLKGED